MTAFAATLAGAGGGMAGGALAHLVVSLADKVGGSALWLKGPYGPPFFNIALFMGLMYGTLGATIGRRRSAALIGFLGPFLGIALPMAVLSRIFPWEEPGRFLGVEVESVGWVRAVTCLFIAAVWGTILGLGLRLGRWRGAAGAVAGSLVGYGLLQLIYRAAPAVAGFWRSGSLWPQPTVLLDGLLTGGGMALGIWFLRRKDNERLEHP